MKNWPRVVVTTRRTVRKNMLINYVGEFHLELLVRLKLLPVMVPVAPGSAACVDQYKAGMCGLLVAEGEDVEPKHYKALPANHKYLEKTHPLKDRIEIDLMKYALKQKLPVMGICRGSQLLNVISGGTLFGDVQKEKKSHRPHVDVHNYHTYRHPVTLVKGTPLAKWYGRREIRVNSFHHQGVRDLAPRFRAMAHADDGLVEAFYDPQQPFVFGLQFHPERMMADYKGNRRVWEAFAAAVRLTSRSRIL